MLSCRIDTFNSEPDLDCTPPQAQAAFFNFANCAFIVKKISCGVLSGPVAAFI